MKKVKKTFMPAILILVAGILYSCSKPGNDISNQTNLGTLKDAIAGTSLTLEITPNPASVGEEVTIIGTFPSGIEFGDALYIQQETSNGWVTVSDQVISGTTVEYVFSPDAAGTFKYRACYFNIMNYTYSSTIDLIVSDAGPCEVPLTLAPELVAVNDLGNNIYQFTVHYTVKACEDFSDMKTQGGLTARCELISTSPPATNIKYTKQNVIINWIEPNVNANEMFVYEVVFTRELKDACKMYDITGSWSTKAWHEVTNKHGGTKLEEYVVGYNNKLSYQTSCSE